MQNPVGEVISLPAPQGISANTENTGYHGDQVTHRVTMETSSSSQAPVSGKTQIEEAHSTTNHLPAQQSDENEEDKKAIYKHPLFPLMALLLEKCEQATQTPDCPSCDSFDVDIQAFVHRQEQERRPFFSDDLELDGLMVKAIQVLRIHLLELEKVSELCKDFCNRYISCLKGKLQSENLLRNEMQNYDGESSGMEDCLMSPGSVISNNNNNNNNLQGVQNSNMNVVAQGNIAQPSSNSVPVGTLGHGQVISGGTVYQMLHTPQGLVAQPIQIQSTNQLSSNQGSTTSVIQGSTPLSQIGVSNTPDTPTQQSPTPSLPKDFNFDDDDFGKRKNKRGILPKHATQVMKSWLFQHIMHPYPTEDEKRQIAGQTNLTMLQVNNWFINARRRILQPMLDASNPEGAKAKKSKSQQTRPVQRFWPENLANLTPNKNCSTGDGTSPMASESPTSTSSPQVKMEDSYVDEDGEDDDEEDEDDDDDEDDDAESEDRIGKMPHLKHPPQDGLHQSYMLEHRE